MIVTADDPRVAAFLEAAADPIDDLLFWADASVPLSRLARLALIEDQALAFAFPLRPDMPSLGVKGRTPEAAERALAEVTAGLSQGYVICPAAQRAFYEARGQVSRAHREAHMTVSSWAPRRPEGVRRATLDELEAFCAAHGAEAWHPLQFQTGPYFVAEEQGRVVAAAGTHFQTPGLAQIGNVLTAPAFRGHGHATRCVEAVADALVAGGAGRLSLFVAEDNPARGLYEKLGFTHHAWLDAFAWSPHPR